MVASQLRGEYVAKNEMMKQYLRAPQPLMAGFTRIWIMHVPRSENQIADALANLATNALYPYNVELSVMECPSTLSTVVTTIDQGAEQS